MPIGGIRLNRLGRVPRPSRSLEYPVPPTASMGIVFLRDAAISQPLTKPTVWLATAIRSPDGGPSL